MTDIVERLRATDSVLDGELPFEAADEIERLTEKVAILEAEIRVMRKLPAEINRRMEIEWSRVVGTKPEHKP